nr:hypothetical protein [Tanacetum cinerariifolium]
LVECERRSPQQPPRAIKCYAIVEAIDFDTGFASFVLGDNPILSLMSLISSLPPLMVCGVGGRLVECERRSPQQPPRAIKCYAIVKAIDFDTGFASFVLGDNPILSLMSPISSLPPLMTAPTTNAMSADTDDMINEATYGIKKVTDQRLMWLTNNHNWSSGIH